MTTLFNGYQEKLQLVELPSTHGNEAAKQLVEQLVTWAPDAKKTQKTDIVMAFWFAELACRDRVMLGNNYRTHQTNSFATPWDKRGQHVVNLLDMEARHLWQPIGA